MIKLPFSNRTEAGRMLGEALSSRTLEPDPIVLALPCGGVAVGAGVASVLKAPLDVLVVRKIGVPWEPDVALGTIADGARILDEHFIRALGIPEEDIERVISRETAELRRGEKLYRGTSAKPDLRGRAVILVDDGLATASNMSVAARAVSNACPGKLIIAAPVGSAQTRRRLAEEADACICLATPEPFGSVGQWYAEFNQLSDAAVQQTLDRFHVARHAAG